MKLFIVVVLYKMKPMQSPSLRSLLAAAKNLSSDAHSLSVLLWDNTPGGQDAGDLPPQVRYHSAPDNPGLSKAYNDALSLARAEKLEWFLTLDQDTTLPGGFIEEVARLCDQLQNHEIVAAIIPRVVGDGRCLSPFWFAGGALPRNLKGPYNGIWNDAIFAVNSAATLRISALCEVGGYNPMFPVDISDIDLFYRLNKAGKQIYVAGNLVVPHEFSLLNKTSRMSVARYRAQLIDECAFWDMHMNGFARIERIVRLLGRMCKDLLVENSREFRRCSSAEIKRRLTTKRATRIAEWKAFASARAERSSAVPLVCGDQQSL